MHPNVAGALINSALYLICVFAAGLMSGNQASWKMALIAMGVTYISHLVQIGGFVSRNLCMGIVMLSIVFGAGAGILLLF